MRIAIVRQAAYPDDPRVRKEAESLARGGHDVTVFCVRTRGSARRETVNDVRIRRLPCTRKGRSAPSYVLYYGSFFVAALFAVGLGHLAGRFEVVQTNSMPDFLVFASVVPKLAGARIVLDLHEAMPELFGSHFGVRAKWVLSALRLQERLSIAFADGVITVSPMLADVFRSRLPAGCDLHVVRNSPSEELFPLADPETLRSLPGDRPPRIVCHGTVAPRYGLQTLVGALSLLEQRGTRFEARIIGDGPALEELRALVERRGLAGCVELPGRLPIEQIPDQLREAQVGIVSLDRDPFTELGQPNKLFEYVALGVPVVASDLCGIREVFGDDEILFFAPGDAGSLADAIESALGDYPAALRRARRALEGAERWRWSVQVASYRRVLHLNS